MPLGKEWESSAPSALGAVSFALFTLSRSKFAESGRFLAFGRFWLGQTHKTGGVKEMADDMTTISARAAWATGQYEQDGVGNFSLIGTRIPKDFFVTRGYGESDIDVHAGSYHLALKKAGIEMCNVITYSSILPRIAQEVEKPVLEHGCVLETIMAAGSTPQGHRATAGIVYGWLYHKKTGEKYGGLVCERSGEYDVEEIEANLNASLQEIYLNGFSEEYDIKDSRCVTQTFVPEKKHGTALVSICFTTYVYPLLLRAPSVRPRMENTRRQPRSKVQALDLCPIGRYANIPAGSRRIRVPCGV